MGEGTTKPGGGKPARRLPILPTLQGYQTAWLTPDCIAGLTLLAIAVPEQMATARLAVMPAITGLYAFVAGSLMIAVLGGSRQMSVGADSTIAPVFAAGVAAVAVAGTTQYQHLVTFLALIVGAVLLAVGLLRLGWIADFISTPVVTGILAGIAVEIVVRQVPAVLGLPGGGTTTIGRVRLIAHQLSHTNGWSLAVGALVLAIILAAEKLDRRVPGALIGLVVSVGAVAALGLKARGVHVLGTIPAGLPPLGPPAVPAHDLVKLAVTAATVAFVCVVQTAATARSLGSDQKATHTLNRDLIGLGAGSLLAGCVGAFPVDSSPPRSAVVEASGGRSQVASLVAAAGALAVIAFATGLLADLPQATLGAILLYVATRLLHVQDLRAIHRFGRAEFGLTVVTIAAVAFFGIETGVLVALVLSIAERTRLATRPQEVLMGREPGTDHWIPVDASHPTEHVPGVLVYLLMAPLWFANAQYLIEHLRDLINTAPEPVRVLIFDAAGVPDVDFTGAQALEGLLKELQAKGIAVGVARPGEVVRRNLRHSDLLATIGREHVYDDVQSAVVALTGATHA
ncbi:MAG TPA: SulP family inorganic anion transporter [Actinomycetota bacterium]|nr:SulP family inorganic anion transporter [Actinomycetota bacterium]